MDTIMRRINAKDWYIANPWRFEFIDMRSVSRMGF